MEKGYYSIRDIKALIFNSKLLYYYDSDSYGNPVEIEFSITSKHANFWIVHVTRFYSEYNNVITDLNNVDYPFTILKEDFNKINRKSKYL
jgi:hypothetical protein